jgi:hypothetical protein
MNLLERRFENLIGCGSGNDLYTEGNMDRCLVFRNSLKFFLFFFVFVNILSMYLEIKYNSKKYFKNFLKAF